jgi:hypothetical protein
MTLGQIAYQGYIAFSRGRSLITGAGLPPWEDQRPDIRQAWEAAGTAVRNALHDEPAATIDYPEKEKS